MSNTYKYTEIKTISGKPLIDTKSRNLLYYDCEEINITNADCFLIEKPKDENNKVIENGTCIITGFNSDKFEELYPDLIETMESTDESGNVTQIKAIKKLIIPVKIKGYTVTKIDITIDETNNNQTKNFFNVKEIILPNSITEFTNQTFSHPWNDDKNICLETIKLSKNITKIPSNAFRYCIKLKNIELHEGIEYINGYAFYGCESINNLKLPNSLKIMGEYSFAYNSWIQTIISIDDNYGDTSYNKCLYLNHSQNIPNNAFYNCFNLETIIIPNGIKKIGNNAFYNCFNLRNIAIPQSIILIDNDMFKTNLIWDNNNKEYIISDNETNLNVIFKVEPNSYSEQFCKNNNKSYEYIYTLNDSNIIDFEYIINVDETCTITKYIGSKNALTINIPEKINGYPVTFLEENFLNVNISDNYLCTTIIMPDSIIGIKPNCFKNLPYLRHIKFSSKLNYIDDNCFVNIGESYAGNDDFTYDILLPNSLNWIGSHCFMWVHSSDGNNNDIINFSPANKIIAGTNLKTIGYDSCLCNVLDLSKSKKLGSGKPSIDIYFSYSKDFSIPMKVYLPNTFNTTIGSYFIYGERNDITINNPTPLSNVKFYVEQNSNSEQWCKDNNREYMLTNVEPSYIKSNFVEFMLPSTFTHDFKTAGSNDPAHWSGKSATELTNYKIGELNLSKYGISNLKGFYFEVCYKDLAASYSNYPIKNCIIDETVDFILCENGVYIGIDVEGNVYGICYGTDTETRELTTNNAYIKLSKYNEMTFS